MSRESTRFVPLHTGIYQHRKTRRAAKALGIEPVHFVAHLLALKCNAMIEAHGGRLDGWDCEDIALQSHWAGSADEWVSALVSCGWLDDEGGTLCLHDWDEYEGTKLAQARAHADRQRAYRGSKPHAEGQDEPEPAAHDDTKDEPTAKAKKAREPRKSIDDLLALPYKGHEKAREYFAKSYPWYDGQPGRMSLDDHYQQMAAWYATKKLKRWETPAAVAAWLDRDTPKAKGMWQRDSGVMPTAAGVVVPSVKDPDAEAKVQAKGRWQVLTSLGHQLPAMMDWYRAGCPEPAGEPERANEARKELGPSPSPDHPVIRLIEAPAAQEGQDGFVPVDQVRELMRSLGASRQKSAAALKAEQDALRQQQRRG